MQKTPPGGAATRTYVYDAGGQLAAEYSNGVWQKDYVRRGGEAGRGSGFGPGTDTVTQRFTGKERDAEVPPELPLLNL